MENPTTGAVTMKWKSFLIAWAGGMQWTIQEIAESFMTIVKTDIRPYLLTMLYSPINPETGDRTIVRSFILRCRLANTNSPGDLMLNN